MKVRFRNLVLSVPSIETAFHILVIKHKSSHVASRVSPDYGLGALKCYETDKTENFILSHAFPHAAVKTSKQAAIIALLQRLKKARVRCITHWISRLNYT